MSAAQHSPARGATCAFLAALCFAGSDVFVRLAGQEVSVWHVVLGRATLGAVVILACARWWGFSVWGRDRRTLWCIGAAGALGIISLTYALTHLAIFEALVLLYSFPAISALISPRLTNDGITWLDWLLISLAFAGAVLVLYQEQSGFSSLGVGHLAGMAAASSYAVTITLTRRVAGRQSALVPYFYICLCSLVVCLPALALRESPWDVSGAALVWVAGVAVSVYGAQVLANKAVESLSSPSVGVILMLEVLFGGLLAWVFFAEGLTPRQLAGGVLILATAVGLSLKHRIAGRKLTADQS